MIVTSNRVLSTVHGVLAQFAGSLPRDSFVVNRDQHGRVRLIVDAALEDDESIHAALKDAARELAAALDPYGVPRRSCSNLTSMPRSPTRPCSHCPTRRYPSAWPTASRSKPIGATSATDRACRAPSSTR